MKRRIRRSTFYLLLVVSLLAGVLPCFPAAAQETTPPPPEFSADPFAEGRVREMDLVVVEPNPGGAVDHYGYRASQAAYAWEDIEKTGKAAAMGNADNGYSEKVELDWDFKFYEYSYSSLYINVDGFLAFDKAFVLSGPLQRIPLEELPNNYIAVFLDDLLLDGSGKIYYEVRGSAPQRRLIVQWEGVTKFGSSDPLSFQVILYENGDIKMQYEKLSGVLNQAAVAIEDADGLDGLVYLQNADGLAPGTAILFKRPGSQARVKVLNNYLGGFVINGKIRYPIRIRNTGERGTDNYSISIATEPGWQARFYRADGRTPLGTKNGSPVTGAVGQGKESEFIVEIRPPSGSPAGVYQHAVLKVTSGLDAARSDVVDLHAAVPTAFTQIVIDTGIGIGLDFISPSLRMMAHVSDWFSGSSLSFDAAGSGYISVIEQNVGNMNTDLEYALHSKAGRVAVPRVKLTENGNSSQLSVRDLSPAVAALPNGKTGVVWQRFRTNNTTNEVNYNIFLTVLDQEGNIPSGTSQINLTKNNSWVVSGSSIEFYSPRIAATAENHFVVAWVYKEPGRQGVTLQWYDENGNEITGRRVSLEGTPDVRYFGDPVIIPLSGNRFLLAYTDVIEENGEQAYRIGTLAVDGGGRVIRKAALIPGATGWLPDGVQVSSGEIILAWTSQNADRGIEFTALSDTTFAPLAGVKNLTNPDGREAGSVSVTCDENGRAVLTWMDQQLRRKLYYALIDGSGTVITPPITFYPGFDVAPQSVMTSERGMGNAPFTYRTTVLLPMLQRK